MMISGQHVGLVCKPTTKQRKNVLCLQMAPRLSAKLRNFERGEPFDIIMNTRSDYFKALEFLFACVLVVFAMFKIIILFILLHFCFYSYKTQPKLRSLKALLFWLRSSLHFLKSEVKHHQNASEEKLKSFKIITDHQAYFFLTFL